MYFIQKNNAFQNKIVVLKGIACGDPFFVGLRRYARRGLPAVIPFLWDYVATLRDPLCLLSILQNNNPSKGLQPTFPFAGYASENKFSSAHSTKEKSHLTMALEGLLFCGS